MEAHSHAVMVASDAVTDRRMEIPGEDTGGSHAATDVVGWYNGQPERAELNLDLTHEHVVVVGNVVIDVASILVTGGEALSATDIVDHALQTLAGTAVRHVDVLGRQGWAQVCGYSIKAREIPVPSPIFRSPHTTTRARIPDTAPSAWIHPSLGFSNPLRRNYTQAIHGARTDATN